MKDRSSRDGASREAGPHISEDLCRDLLAGYLPPAEEEATLKHIAGCAACERFFAERALEREHLRASMELSRQAGGHVAAKRRSSGEERVRAEEGPLRSGRLREAKWEARQTALLERLWRPWPRFALGLGMAAAIVLLILWPRPESVPGSALLRWMPEGPGQLLLRSSTPTPGDRLLAEGFAAYAERDLNGAIRRLREASATGQLELLRRLYLANALAWAGEHAAAAQLLRTIPADIVPDPWGGEGQWTLFVALRESGQTAAADSLLQVLSTERGEIGERAQSLRGP